MSATYELRGPVAVITLDNPPVNGLGYDTRKGITDGLDKAQAESGTVADMKRDWKAIFSFEKN